MLKRPLTLLVILQLASCKQSTQSNTQGAAALPLSNREVLEDFDTLTAQIKSLYGPLEFKENKFNFKFEQLVADTRAQLTKTTSEPEKIGLFFKFLARFQDGHVSMSVENYVSQVNAYNLGVFFFPLEGKTIVAQVDTKIATSRIQTGDELVSIDGATPASLLTTIKKYHTFANKISDQFLVYMVAKRPFYMTELVPKNPTAILKLKRPDGSLYTAELIWEKDFSPLGKTNFVSPKGDYLMISAGYKKFNKAAAGSGFEMGGWRPFFVPENSENSSKLMEVEANKKHLERYKVKLENKGKTNQFPFFAALYKYRGKTILLVRQATYSPELSDSTMIGAYQALLDQYEEFADVLVIDQTFNPGGSVDYAEKFFRLFVKPRQEAKSAVQAMNVDRRWVRTFNEWAQAFLAKDQELSNRFLLRAKQIDDALNSGLSITSPMTLFSKATITGDPVFTWKKPVLVLANELSGSCGDFFPFLMKENGIAKIFGERTMGLGGNVEEVVTLPNSQARISLTRGLATLYSETGIYKDSDYIENKGVEPNFPHKLTFDDFLSGFPDYLDAVSKKAIEQIGNSMNCSPNQCLDNDPQEFAADEGLAAPAKPANSPATGK